MGTKTDLGDQVQNIQINKPQIEMGTKTINRCFIVKILINKPQIEMGTKTQVHNVWNS